MSEIEEHNLGDEHKKLIFPCDCNDNHFLILDWDDDDREWRYLFMTNEWRPGTVRQKIKDTWRLWRNKGYVNEEIVLNDQVIAKLKKFLEDK